MINWHVFGILQEFNDYLLHKILELPYISLKILIKKNLSQNKFQLELNKANKVWANFKYIWVCRWDWLVEGRLEETVEADLI